MPILSNRKLAYVLTVLAYRECGILEDHHSAHDNLSMDIYNEVYHAVKGKLEEYESCIEFMKIEPDECPREIENADEQLKRYVFYFLLIARSIHTWLPAKAYTGKIPQDIVEYMLAGTFKQFCEDGIILDNTAMKALNIDVHNRVYTLICRGKI